MIALSSAAVARPFAACAAADKAGDWVAQQWDDDNAAHRLTIFSKAWPGPATAA